MSTYDKAEGKKKPTKADLEEIHRKAVKRCEEAWVFERDNVTAGREDQTFYAGDQWDAAAKKARGADRPMLTINRLGTFVRQVTGDIRQNTPAIKVLPARGKASIDKAEVLSGMIRSIEADSDAPACYAKAADNVAQAGQGAFRVKTEYVSPDSFDQCIYIRPIPDPFAVLIDPMAILLDKSDMGYAYVFEHMSKEDFKAKYPKAEADDFPAANSSGFLWAKGEAIRIAEYWCRETVTRKVYLLEDGSTVDEVPAGQKAVREREAESVEIVSYLMTGKEILSGPHEYAGKYIPICFIPGEETTIDGATRRKGMVRDAKDPQRLVNYARTTEAESTALQPKAPFILTKDEINGYESMWRTAGTTNHPYLLINRKQGDTSPMPQRSQPPVMSTGLANLSQTAGMDLHDVTGIYPASLGAKSNETSGVAIRARQHEGDTGSNYIPDNTKRAIAYCGRILCDLIPKIYDAPRIVRILKEDGSHEMAKINAEQLDPDDDPKLKVINTFTDGEYDVVVSTGPSYATRQQEQAENMLQLAEKVPQVAQVAPDLLVKALNFPGGDQIAKRLEKMLPPGLTEDGPMPQPAPDPEKMAEVEETLASANLKTAQASKTFLEADALFAQMNAMGAQIMDLTQLVKGLVQQPAASPTEMQPPPTPIEAPPMAPPANGAAGPSAIDEMPELEPMPEGAPI